MIVSHSAKLAEGVVELARNMGGADSHIQAAGGLDMPEQPLGTDPMLILNAIEGVYSDDGVLVLMDLGSAILSAEMAIDMLPEEKRPHVLLCEAPIVEGAISAAVQARIGSPLQQVAAEARGALAAKVEQLGPAVQEASPEQPSGKDGSGEEKIEIRIKVNNSLGLHARPAARFVKTAGGFDKTDIRVTNLTTGRGPVNAKSINAITTLGVLHGHEILVSTSGCDAQAALNAIQELANDNFGDIEQPGKSSTQTAPVATPPAKDATTASLHGVPTSGGIAIGPVQIFRPVLPSIPTHLITNPSEEWESLKGSIEKTRTQVKADLETAKKHTDAQTADIFEAHLLFLEDEELLLPAKKAIFDQKLNAAAAWHEAIEQVVAQYDKTADAYLQARAKDVEDIGRQVLMNLLKLEISAPQLTEPSILIASDLTPAETARLDSSMVLGICTALGGVTSHAAILARSMGIPAISGIGNGILNLASGTVAVMDGDSGDIWVNPLQKVVDDYTQLAAIARAAKAKAQAESQPPAITLDGRRVEVAANIGSAEDARAAVLSGAEGVGLFRTEFLFLQRQTAPSEDEQFEAYRAAAKALEGRPLVIRTLDAGGDKVLPYLQMETEANPFLGWRAIRLCLAMPDLFKTQLRAIVRVAAESPIKVMFPMVATLSEWRAARGLLQEAIGEVRKGGHNAPDKIETGIMVEIPAAAIKAGQFAKEVDFFSIGTNDLTQYTMAAERGNSHVAALSDPFHPAILELIQRVVNAAHTNGKWAGVCGEMAGDPRAVSLLVGLGVDELSMSAPSIPKVKQIIRNLEYKKVCLQASTMLVEESPEAVREKMR
ncbi:MAG: phosphoenolpyruvate--protein phosphotransferase [Anaerolineales bacterium]